MKLCFDTKGNLKQKECAKVWCDNTVTDIAYGGSKGSAKSYTGCSLIFGDALIYPETHYFIARKKLNDLRKFTIPSIHEVFEHWGITSNYYKYNGQDNFFELYNKSKVFLLDAKYLPSDPMFYRFGSMQNTRGWIEEAGEFTSEATNNLKASVGRWKNEIYGINGKVLQTCNPSKNYLYKDFYKPNKEGSLKEWQRFIQAMPQDNKQLSKDYLIHLDRTLSKNEKERLLKGNWEYDDNPNALCDYDSILAVFHNDHIKAGKKYLTADIARFGSDKAIVLVWDEWIVIEAHIFDKSKTTQIQDCINSMRIKHTIPKHFCIADEDGVGGGVVDNCGIKGFVNNSIALPELVSLGMEKTNFQNLQTQCIYYFAKKVNENGVYFRADISDKHKEEIVEELETIESYKSDLEGKLRIIPKEQVKDKIGRSPDWRDVLMMRYWFDLKPILSAPTLNVTRKR
ncbi:MAG: terminase [Bacteroidota bacterium]